MLILDVLASRVAGRPDHPFILHSERRVTYREFDQLSNRAAHAFLSLGVKKGDRVTLAMANSIDYLVATFGALKTGAVYNPVNPALGARELGYILGHAAPKVIVTDDANASNVFDADIELPKSCVVATFGAERALRPKASEATKTAVAVGTVSLDDLIARTSPHAPLVTLGADDPSTLLYTSGTTGNPKGVLFRHGSTGAAGCHFLETLGITADDVILAVTPLFHGNAWGAVITALQAGGTVAYPKAFRASEFWPLVHRTRATVLYTLGTILAILLTHEPSDLERTSPLRVILGLGSAPIRNRIIRRFGVQHVAECFGSTDAGVVTITPLGSEPRLGSAGPPVPGVSIRVVGDDGKEMKTGEVGEITVGSPHCMSEYFRDPEQTAETLRDGWFYTGDLGYVDADGWLYFVDRKKDVIRRGGENMSSVLIEKVLREHPQVAEVAVIGVPDPVLGQEVKAFIVRSGEITERELRDYASEHLAKFQVPRLWEFRDSLPKTPSQRVEKYKLRQEAAGSGKPLLG